MGHIKEPKGVDFLIKSEALTKNDKAEITEFIAQHKAKRVKSKKVAKSKKKELI